MKTLRLLKRTPVLTGFSFMLMLLLLAGCEKKEGFINAADESPGALLKSAGVVDMAIELKGSTHFPSYALKEQRVISPWDLNMLECKATLTPVGKQDYILETEEYFGTMLFRKISYEVKMTPGGSLKFCWPETWEELDFSTGQVVPNTMSVLEQMRLHTGCEIYGGPGVAQGTVLYKGHFDGTVFYAAIMVIGEQKEFGTVAPFYTTPPLIDGPIKFEFSIELEVVEE
ncbi:MAG: hypothetical protein JXR52_07510 [Bacteroidales bacterium]|nr:hypothetical protein [Bacteroidales bacterium]